MALLQNVIQRGTHAARPAAGSAGVLYYEVDTGQLFRDNGSSWDLDDTTLLYTAKGQLLASSASSAVGALAAGTNGYVLTADSAQTLGVKWAAAAGVSLSTVSNLLSGDVTMTSANTYYDGPSVSCAAGTWLLVGGVVILSTLALHDATAKLWDGTTVYASQENSGQSGTAIGLALAGIVTPGSTTTYKISAASQHASCAIKAAAISNGAGNNASFLYGIKVA